MVFRWLGWMLDPNRSWTNTRAKVEYYNSSCLFFQQMRKSSFQGSLYLSRESLGNHFFEEFQNSRAVDVGVYRKRGEFQGHPLVFILVFSMSSYLASWMLPRAENRLEMHCAARWVRRAAWNQDCILHGFYVFLFFYVYVDVYVYMHSMWPVAASPPWAPPAQSWRCPSGWAACGWAC
jgi:hypothetical protein